MRKRPVPVLNRRDLLRWAGVAGASTLAACGNGTPAKPQVGATPASPPPPPPYFTSEEASILKALADAVLPPDDAPGGGDLGVVTYVANLLTAFENDPPAIFAGGPYSGREAVPSADGSPSGTFPGDDFATFLPLDRVQTAGWKLRIYGSAGVTGGGPNDAITGPVIGLREAVATAISTVKMAAPPSVSIDDLTQDEKVSLLTALDATTRATVIELVLEAAFTAPEYGGNPGEAGWKMVYFEGDSQPLGYSWFDTSTGEYTEDPEHPVSTKNPQPDPMPLSASTEQTLSVVITVLGGTVFS